MKTPCNWNFYFGSLLFTFIKDSYYGRKKTGKFENFSLKYRIPPVRWHQRNLINHSPNWVFTTVVNEKTKAFARMANGKIWTFVVPLCLRAVWAMIWKMSCAFNGLYYFLNYFRDDKSIEIIIQKELVKAGNFL